MPLKGWKVWEHEGWTQQPESYNIFEIIWSKYSGRIYLGITFISYLFPQGCPQVPLPITGRKNFGEFLNVKFRSIFFVPTFHLSSMDLGPGNPSYRICIFIGHNWENLIQDYPKLQWPLGLYTNWFPINLPALISYHSLPGSLCSNHSGIPVFLQI